MKQKVYVDTALLVKGYVFETNSREAIAILDALEVPLLLTHIHEIEVPNAIRLKRFRGEITKAEEAASLRLFHADLKAGRLVRPEYKLADVFRRAEKLSASHSGEIGTRSMDILHVAAALEIGCTTFASFDERQRKCAARAGLKIIPEKFS